MIRRQVLSAYTPSNTDPEILKRIFVQREELLSLITNRLGNSTSTGDMYHALLVGPRGSGKTHFVSLVEWDLGKRPALDDTLRICWLGEDDSFTALIYLAFGIAKQLAHAYPDEFPDDFKEAVRGLPQQDAALAALNNVVSQLGNRTLLLITENLDKTFPSFGSEGRSAWRAFLQENRCISTLATSQMLFDDVSKRDATFFGFYDIHHLQALSVNDAHALIRRIAAEQKNHDLIKYLDSTEGRYRIRALHYLAGGNHRMYVLLSEFLTRDSLDSLVTAFEDLAEEMTPYFQERMRALPDQQRQIAQCLCDAEGAMTVKSIAHDTFIDERTVSSQLKNLKDRHYVCSVKRGKESYYDMAEPLMRLCLEVKNQRGEPLRMVVRFLKAWFPQATLKDTGKFSGLDGRTAAYSQKALLTNGAFNNAIAQSINEDIYKKIQDDWFSKVLATDKYKRSASKPGTSIDKSHHEEIDAALHELAAVIDMDEMANEQRATAQINRGAAYRQQGKIELAAADFTAVITMDDAPPELRAEAQFNRGFAYGQRGKIELAVADFTAVITMDDAPPELRAEAQFFRGLTYGQQGKIEFAVADCTAVIAMDDAPPDLRAEAQFFRGLTYRQPGKIELAVADYTAVINMDDAPPEQRAKSQVNRGIAYGRQGKIKLEVADYTAVIDMDDAPPELRADAQFNRGIAYGRQGKIELEVADYTAVIDMDDAPPELRAEAQFNRGIVYGQQGKIELEVADYTAVINMDDAPPEQRADAQFNRGIAYSQQGKIELEVADYTAVIDMDDAPPELRAEAQFNRGFAYSRQGKIELEVADYTAVINMDDAPPEQRARSQFNRGFVYGRQGKIELEVADYTAVINMDDAAPEQRARSQFNRGFAYGQQGKIKLEVADFTAVITMDDAPPELRAEAQFNRGFAYGRQGKIELEVVDYTAVINMDDASPELRAEAQYNRGIVYGQQGKIELEVADFTAVIDMDDASPELRASAFNSRGSAYWQTQEFESSARDFNASLSIEDSKSLHPQHVTALFSLAEPLIAIDTLEEVLKTLDQAMRLRKEYAVEYAGTPQDIILMILKRPVSDWKQYASSIAKRYIDNDLADQLGQGITRSIELLDKEEITKSTREEWLSIWHSVGDAHNDLTIPLQCLDAGVAVMNSGPQATDVPLLGLPPELRKLVRPMLNATLGEEI